MSYLPLRWLTVVFRLNIGTFAPGEVGGGLGEEKRVLRYLAILFVGAALGVCGTMAFHIDRPGPSAGDWLLFAGAVVGVILTISGTLIIDNFRTEEEEKKRRKLLLTILSDIEEHLVAASANVEDLPVDSV